VRTTVLIVDDEPLVAASLARVLEHRGHATLLAETGAQALDTLAAEPVDLALLDLQLPDGIGLDVLSEMRRLGHDQPVIMVSGVGTIDTAVEATRRGALDFLEKPVAVDRLIVTVERALEFTRIARGQAALEAEQGRRFEIIGSSAPMRALRELVRRLAPTEARVLIVGESGTGKELVARALQRGSTRRGEPFVQVNCAAIPAELVESELFGHERGAFTGAAHARRGRFELADGGTLLLDEVGDMPLAMQAKVLRALETGEVERVGGTAPIRVDVRVLAATNRSLEELSEQGLFRRDLYYRLNVMRIEVPPLRERTEDIAELVDRFIADEAKRTARRPARLTEKALGLLAGYRYPGNVRELRNLVERLFILVDGEIIDERAVASVLPSTAHAPAHAGARARSRDGAAAAPGAAAGASYRMLLAQAERRILEEALAANEHNMSRTARALGLERSHLYKKCRALGLGPRPR
jgi:DNA-binding NtrC family response regulator